MNMKEGDLLLCLVQPRTSYPVDLNSSGIQKYKLKGETCIYIKEISNILCKVVFPKYGYEHVFVKSSLQKI